LARGLNAFFVVFGVSRILLITLIIGAFELTPKNILSWKIHFVFTTHVCPENIGSFSFYDASGICYDMCWMVCKQTLQSLRIHFPLKQSSLIGIFWRPYVNSVREKNIQNTMLKNLLDLCGAALAYWAMGYAIAYGTKDSSGTTFIGTTNFLLYNLQDYSFWFFEFAFAATTTTIVAGTLAERSQMGAYFLYSMLLTAFVYPVVCHAVWSSHGFLSPRNPRALIGSGAIDFAGGGKKLLFSMNYGIHLFRLE